MEDNMDIFETSSYFDLDSNKNESDQSKDKMQTWRGPKMNRKRKLIRLESYEESDMSDDDDHETEEAIEDYSMDKNITLMEVWMRQMKIIGHKSEKN